MKKVIIIQARLGSSRLPGKVLKDLAGRPMIAQQIERLRRCRLADEILIATTATVLDDPLAAWAQAAGVRCVRGDENDVLDRYRQAAQEAQADVVTRVTGDCPLIDPEQTDRVIAALLESPESCDYASNVVERTLPRGLDAEAMLRATLETLHASARSAPAREHVTHYLLQEHPERFRIRSVKEQDNHSDLRWCVDTLEDFQMTERLYRDLDLGRTFRPYREILAHVRAHPDIAQMNAGIKQKVL